MSGSLPDMRPLTDRQARMVESVLPMIGYFYRRSGLNLDQNQFDEFLSHAHDKLCTAVKAHDPERGSWPTLAGTCIQRHMKEWAAMARMDISRRELRILRSESAGRATPHESVRAHYLRTKASLDDKTPNDVHPLERIRCLRETPEESAMMHELWRLLDVVLSRRQDPQRDREVMLSHMEGEAYAEIAKRLGISRERVRQIHSDVRDKLRAELEDG